MNEPRLLDLFCGAGGAGEGYRRAGFEVVGVDIKPQPRYKPGRFVQADALQYLAEHGHEYDAIHASPPCQRYSSATPEDRRSEHPDLIEPVRNLLISIGVPWVMENVEHAPLINPLKLCGTMFNLNVIRHRLFEMSHPVYFTPQCAHVKKTVRQGYALEDNQYHCVVGNFSGVSSARRAMGIDWMTRDELSQAIPPAYTEFIGNQLMNAIKEESR